MEITEVRVSLRDDSNRKLKAYATMTFDNAFVVRNVKVIEGNKGLFVAMPSRKMRESCPKCNFKNTVRSKFCNQCGSSLPVIERKPQAEGEHMQHSEHRDIAHPITLECREYIQKKILEAYEAERKKAPQERAPAPEAPRTERPEPPPEAPKTEGPEPQPERPEPQSERPEPHQEEIEGGDIEL